MYQRQGAPLAMLDSDIDVTVRGPIVEATVTQTFRNDTDRPTEATYIFSDGFIRLTNSEGPSTGRSFDQGRA